MLRAIALRTESSLPLYGIKNVRMLVRGREQFKKYKKCIYCFVRIIKCFPLSIRKKMFEYMRMVKGKKGQILRYIIFKSIAKSCGENVLIQPGVYIFSPENISIGNNVSIHSMSYIDAYGGINIGNDVSIAHGVTIMTSTHRYESKSIPIRDQGFYSSETCINSNVWIGAKATILYGTSIGSGSIIGANTVITKDILENSIMIGYPAKLLKKRE